MAKINLTEWAHGVLAGADIQINGSRPWDIQVHNDKLFERVAAEGTLGLGEAYMDGWWDCEALDEFFAKATGNGVAERVRMRDLPLVEVVKAKLKNP
jgi:cyclopropane-fatty-acyl-phospholipid synthase